MTKLTLAADFPPVSQQDWQAQAAATIKSDHIGRLTRKTLDGLAIAPIYPTPEEKYAPLATPDHGLWDVVQRADISEFSAANEQILQDLLYGASGISMVLPGAVNAGSYGLPVRSPDDIKRVMRGVELDLMNLRLDGTRGARHVARWLLQVYKDRNYDLSRCRLTLGLDPVGHFSLGGSAPGDNDLAKRMAAIFNTARDMGHKGGVFCGDGRIFHEAGASEAQELGLAIASAVQQLRLLERAGVAPSVALPHMTMMLSADADQFTTICKLRAARLLWQLLGQSMGLVDIKLQLDVETSGRMMSRRDPYVNMLRTTTATFSAAIGGADSVAVLAYSTAFGLADGFARRMARNNQLVLQEESHIGIVGDAGAGAGYVENLTSALAEKAWQVFQQVEKSGGMLSALENELIQKQIGETIGQRRSNIAYRKQGLIGISEFANLDETPVKVLEIKPVRGWHVGDEKTAGERRWSGLERQRLAQPFEDLRQKAAAGSEPMEVVLVTPGSQTDFAARAAWASNLFAAGGIKTTSNSTGKVACICSSDAVYAEQAAAKAQQLKADGFAYVWLAGRPGPLEDELLEAGVDGFLFAGCDVLKVLEKTQQILGEPS
jgi:methylmalonyl-CoA mutase